MTDAEILARIPYFTSGWPYSSSTKRDDPAGPGPEGVEIARPGTREAVAGLIGIVRELVSRSLARMARDGPLVLRGRRVVLRDLSGIRRLAGQDGGPAGLRPP
jgi:hypothetical protein